MGFTGFYPVLLGFTGFYLVLLGFSWILSSYTDAYWVLPSFTKLNRFFFYWVFDRVPPEATINFSLPSFTRVRQTSAVGNVFFFFLFLFPFFLNSFLCGKKKKKERVKKKKKVNESIDSSTSTGPFHDTTLTRAALSSQVFSFIFF